ncbi:hypothetical protein PR202_ga31410 [Eleusine coracana subsp. coracana]|uniref:Rab-GAP TBC domain-containing protein n=1 Tax=Eleusine coracana subsp. coracana TaxID=191504 RepID=A0AAV5DS54_ELECO|nr:hypothetical protein PR202_ga31410 [Eleusine coracana subsp. coracana]
MKQSRHVTILTVVTISDRWDPLVRRLSPLPVNNSWLQLASCSFEICVNCVPVPSSLLFFFQSFPLPPQTTNYRAGGGSFGSSAGMRKKGRAAVPEWLNSPIWSVPQPPPAPPDPYGADLVPPPPPPPKPAAPAVPPPPSYAEAVGERGGRRRGHEVEEEDEDDGLAGAVIRAHLLADSRPRVQLLLGYLPTDRDFWPHDLQKKRSQYSVYKEEFLLNPSEKLRRIEESKLLRKKELKVDRIGLLPRSKVTDEEHPLSFGRSSLWNQYFQESEVLEQIDRDVKRTHPDIPFFSVKSNQESLRRILIIFSKLNPSIRYVQGMNEVLAPLFYVLKNDPDTSNSDTLLRICCAMLILVRKRLLAGDFTANIQLLQHYPATNIDHLLHIANRLRGTVAS